MYQQWLSQFHLTHVVSWMIEVDDVLKGLAALMILFLLDSIGKIISRMNSNKK